MTNNEDSEWVQLRKNTLYEKLQWWWFYTKLKIIRLEFTLKDNRRRNKK